MKTKIIYISGSEVFDMTEIRAAFDEVRSALGLDNDTVLFGVPVDCDSAIKNTDTSKTVVTQTTAVQNETVVGKEENNVVSMDNTVVDNALEIKDSEETITPEPEAEITEIKTVDTDETVIPILSVLSINDDETPVAQETAPLSETEEIQAPADAEETFINDDVIVQPEEVDNEPVISSISIDSELITPATDNDGVATTVSVTDMINDEAPEKSVEKTLEHLLESMTPLREDLEIETENNDFVDNDEPLYDITDSDTDATLAQLASEFVQTEDTIETTQKNESHGKIGKLKNILPFKKAKRDDGGLMGDLFGWAGIAANDDDFSIPGFFTKKQGA